MKRVAKRRKPVAKRKFMLGIPPTVTIGGIIVVPCPHVRDDVLLASPETLWKVVHHYSRDWI